MEKSVFLQEKYVRLYKIVAVTAGVYLAFRYGLPLFAPFIAAYLLAGAVRPVVLFLRRRLHLPVRVGGVLVVFLLVGGLLTGLVYLGKLLVEQVMRLVGNYGSYKDAALEAAERVCSRVDGWFALETGTAGKFMYTGLSRVSETVNEEVLPALSKQSLSVLGTFVYGVAGVIIAVVAAVLLLGDGGKYAKGCRKSPFYEEVKRVTGRLSEAGVAYLKTQGILMTLVAVICTVGFLFVKPEYALLFGEPKTVTTHIVQPRLDTADKGLDGFRLVAGRRIFTYDLEFSHWFFTPYIRTRSWRRIHCPPQQSGR